jgi:hypothetical protein
MHYLNKIITLNILIKSNKAVYLNNKLQKHLTLVENMYI